MNIYQRVRLIRLGVSVSVSPHVYVCPFPLMFFWVYLRCCLCMETKMLFITSKPQKVVT